jgi:hypothetical protein
MFSYDLEIESSWVKLAYVFTKKIIDIHFTFKDRKVLKGWLLSRILQLTERYKIRKWQKFKNVIQCVMPESRVWHGRLFDNNKIPTPILNIFIFAIK